MLLLPPRSPRGDFTTPFPEAHPRNTFKTMHKITYYSDDKNKQIGLILYIDMFFSHVNIKVSYQLSFL